MFRKGKATPSTPSNSAKRPRGSDSPEVSPEFDKMGTDDKLVAMMSEIMGIKSVVQHVEQFLERADGIETQLVEVTRKLEFVQKELNRKKVRICGLGEKDTENFASRAAIVQKLFQEELGIKETGIR